MGACVQMLGDKPPQNESWPLEHGDHHELDDLEFLNDEDSQKHQSIVGLFQWVIAIGHLDVTTAIVTLSSFYAMP